MSHPSRQQGLFEGAPPAAQWEQDVAKRALDELFSLARRYRSGPDFRSLMEFVRRFRFYSAFNAMLVHIQMPGATYVAPASRWHREFGRRIGPDARPLVILQPMGPVMFVFDVSGTIEGPHSRKLPREVTEPFEVRNGRVGAELQLTIANAKRDGVEVSERDAGSQSAGLIRTTRPGRSVAFEAPKRSEPTVLQVPLRYELLLNRAHSAEAKYATLTHELGHLYCGHVGTPNDRWWPDRRGLQEAAAEFEAESVCYLVCGRLSIDNPSETYLAGYLAEGREVPSISLECVMKTVGLIEQMGRDRMNPRKARD